jgi:hypothetical protein
MEDRKEDVGLERLGERKEGERNESVSRFTFQEHS